MDTQTLETIYKNFTQELQHAYQGKTTSLAFIKNPLPQNVQVHEGDIFQVMSVGGVNFKSAVIQKAKEGFTILERTTDILPPFQHKQSLFSFLQKHVSDRTNLIALNFAYPSIPDISDDKLDAILTRPTKGHAFDGLIGKKIGEEFEVYMGDSGHKGVRVFVANDAVCLLLSGLSGHLSDCRKYVHKLMPAYSPTFITIKDSDLLGAAKLVG